MTNDTTISIFLNAKALRELKMNDNKTVSVGAIPDLETLARMDDSTVFDNVGAYPWYLVDVPSPKACSRLSPRPPSMDPALVRPITVTFDQLRIVDLTSCTGLTDLEVDHLVHNAPQLRTLTLAKCTNLTDFAVESISRLGKYLHYLHLGHVRKYAWVHYKADIFQHHRRRRFKTGQVVHPSTLHRRRQLCAPH